MSNFLKAITGDFSKQVPQCPASVDKKFSLSNGDPDDLFNMHISISGLNSIHRKSTEGCHPIIGLGSKRLESGSTSSARKALQALGRFLHEHKGKALAGLLGTALIVAAFLWFFEVTVFAMGLELLEKAFISGCFIGVGVVIWLITLITAYSQQKSHRPHYTDFLNSKNLETLDHTFNNDIF